MANKEKSPSRFDAIMHSHFLDAHPVVAHGNCKCFRAGFEEGVRIAYDESPVIANEILEEDHASAGE